MIKSKLSFLMIPFLFFMLAFTFSSSVEAADMCGGVSSPGNPFPCCTFNGNEKSGNCTWWAAHKRPDIAETKTDSGWHGKYWIEKTKDNFDIIYPSQLDENNVPPVDVTGSIIVWGASPKNDSGHVAYVEKDYGNGKIKFSQMNCGSDYGVSSLDNFLVGQLSDGVLSNGEKSYMPLLGFILPDETKYNLPSDVYYEDSLQQGPVRFNSDDQIDFTEIGINGYLNVYTGNENGIEPIMSDYLVADTVDWMRNDIHRRIWRGDYEGDGDLDFIGLTNQGEVVVWTQDEDGKFNGHNGREYLVSNTMDWMRNDIHERLWLRDYEGDGDLDFIGLSNDGKVIVWTQDANGKFNGYNAKEHLVADTLDWMRTDIHRRLWLEDYEGDGDMDFIGLSNSGEVIVWTQDADGKFNGYNAKEHLVADTMDWMRNDIHERLWLRDYEGDGDLDFIGITNAGEYVVWTQDANGKFNGYSIKEHFVRDINDWFSKDTHNRIWVTDFDNDSDIDVVGLDKNGYVVIWEYDSSNGKLNRFMSKEYLVSDSNDWLRNDIHPRLWLRDYEGDGDLDFIGITKEGDVVIWDQVNKRFGSHNGRMSFIDNIFISFTKSVHFRF